MHPTADTLLLKYLQSLGAAGDAGRWAACLGNRRLKNIVSLHAIVKITLRSTDFERTRRFYCELFGWEFRQHSPTYLEFEPPSGIDGGFQRVDSFNRGDSYLLYILVDEFESYLRR